MPQLCALLPSFQLASCYVVGIVRTSLDPWRINVKSIRPNYSGDDRQDMQSHPNTLDHEALFRDYRAGRSAAKFSFKQRCEKCQR